MTAWERDTGEWSPGDRAGSVHLAFGARWCAGYLGVVGAGTKVALVGGMSIRVVFVIVFLAACDVGSVEPLEPGTDAPALVTDAAGGDGGVVCEPAATNLPNGEHNPGQPCLTCHGPGGEGPRFTIGGTIFSTAQGGVAVAGATVVVVDASNVTTRLVSASNGNFYSNANLTLPLRVSASKCPDTKPMIGAIASAQDGDCNGCHQAGTSGRIHLP